MYIAAMTEYADLQGIVSEDFASAPCLLIIDHDVRQIVKIYDRWELPEDTQMAEKIVEHDCEALLCGPIEKEPFTIVADEGCVTRYQASGLTVADAMDQMDRYNLAMITDHIGGTGCGSGQPDSCDHHHHGE